MIVTDWQARHGLTAADHQAEFDRLTSNGYRLLKIAGYEFGGAPRFASIWAVQGGSGWQARHGISADDYQAAVTALSRDGFRPVDLSVFRSGNDVLFSAIWEQEEGLEWTAHHALTGDEYQALFNDLSSQGFRLRCVSPYEDQNGERFACVWDRYAGPAWEARHGLTAQEYQDEFDAQNQHGFRLVRVVGYSIGGQIRYAGIWEQSPGHPGKAAHGVAHDDYQGQFDANVAAGLRLVDVSGSMDGGSARYTTIWESTPETDFSATPAASLVVPFMQKWAVPGFSFAIARNGTNRATGAFGYANRITREIATPDHRFRIASVTKPITSTAVHLLIEQGQLALTDPVFGTGALLGTTYGTQGYSARVLTVQLQHLLEHSAGGWTNDSNDPMFQQTQLEQDALISWTLDNRPLTADPGTTYGYSNFGYCLLGRIIERVSGLSYAQFVHRFVLDPSNAGQSVLAGTTAAGRQGQEAMYFGLDRDAPYEIRVDRMDSHGGWVMTPAGMLRFLFSVDGLPSSPDLLRPATLTAMTTASAVRPVTPTHPGYARGWAVNSAGTIWHDGTLPGTQSILVRPSDGRAWSAVCNTGRPNTPLDQEFDDLMWQVQQVV
ncbi:serine hydrolase [Streptomyces hesseae]|uniref:Serine hydrolase n=1 Tax=Streptomyces hesseae TaxID=3075519 RepID=A0ABU2SVT7_9ACTN|nr:serine hydrolase [Streptomyces sp. DSM 40473]MDT0453113.1 serine hydrolase [Streptomyces sp. DSM 40473]